MTSRLLAQPARSPSGTGRAQLRPRPATRHRQRSDHHHKPGGPTPLALRSLTGQSCSSWSTSDRWHPLRPIRWGQFSGWRGCTRAMASTLWPGEITSRSAMSTSRPPTPELQDVLSCRTSTPRSCYRPSWPCRERGPRPRFDRVRLGVSADGAAAQAFYRRCGYIDSGDAPRRVKGTIEIRTGPSVVDDTLLTWEKRDQRLGAITAHPLAQPTAPGPNPDTRVMARPWRASLAA